MKLLKVFIVVCIVVFSFSVFAEELKNKVNLEINNTIPIDYNYSWINYNWISFSSGGDEIARVDENCKIHKRVKVGKFIQAELDKYSGICKEIKEIDRKLKKEKASD
jgi:hypothetical protein